MKKTAFLFLTLFIFFTAKCQVKGKSLTQYIITGKVTDSITGKPLENATISLLKKNSNKSAQGIVADQNGAFSFTVGVGSYKVTIDFINYSTVVFNNIIISVQNPVADLGTISLRKKSKMLTMVNIIAAPKNIIENRIDKIVFNADQDVTSQGAALIDILKKVPQVSVDIDGNVQLAGSSSIRFLIDGKPSTAFGNNITDVLQSIPASQVKSIEVITNPGAKYDAEGLGGIINIVLKKNTAQGINGNMSLTAGTIIENGAFNFNVRKNNFGINAFINANARRSIQSSGTYNRTAKDDTSAQVLTQNSNSTFLRHGIESGIGFDWSYNKKNNFSGSVNYNMYGDSTKGFYEQSQVITPSNPGSAIEEMITNNYYNNRSAYHGIDANFNYKRTFDKEGRNLEIAINSSFGKDAYNATNMQFAVPADTLNFGTINNNPGKENQVEYKLDYDEPVSKNFIISAGGKVTVSNENTSSMVSISNTGANKYYYESSLSNELQYHQIISAGYAEVSFSAGKLFDAKVGGRIEHTYIHSFFSNTQYQFYRQAYNTFVPSVFLLRKLGENHTIKLNYTRRIERPEYSDLDPFINTSDPKNLTSGNPYLVPETGSRIELSYNWDFSSRGSFNATAFYRVSNHDIQNYVTYYPSLLVGDSVYNNVSISKRENIGLERNTGVSLFGSMNFTKKFSVRLNAFVFFRHTSNTIDTGYNSQSFNYRFNINTSYEFTKNLSAEFFGNFNSPRHEVQGSYPSFISYSVAIRKQFWNKNGSLAFTATDPFNKYIYKRTTISGPAFVVNELQKVYFRSIGINFTWKFGNLEFKSSKEYSQVNLGANDKE